MTYITNLGSEENNPALDMEMLKYEIRDHYRAEYLSREKRRDPQAGYLTKLFSVGGVASVAAAAGLALTFPASPLVIFGVALLAAGGGAGYLAAEKMYYDRQARAKAALDEDLDNFTLVKRYVTTVLAGRQSTLDKKEKIREQENADWRRQFDSERKMIARVRKAAVSLLAQGIDKLEADAREGLDEISALKKEAASFAAEFGGVAEKVTAKPDVPTARPYTSAHRSDVGLGP